MEIGFVYIITTKLYEPLDIFKIGCTKNIEQRLKTINATRTAFDKFYISNCIKTFHYFKLESGLHHILQKFRLNNEFFQCSINTIDEAISEYVSKNVFLLHDDQILQEAENKNLKWFPKNDTFSIMDLPTPLNGWSTPEIFFNETTLIEEIKQWISIFDKYNLYKFLHPSHFNRIITHFKINRAVIEEEENVEGVEEKDIIEEDISEEMNRLFICQNDKSIETFVEGGQISKLWLTADKVIVEGVEEKDIIEEDISEEMNRLFICQNNK